MKQFEQDFEQLKQRLLRMVSLVENAVHSSMQALMVSDESAAKKVIEEDQGIDRQQLQIDEDGNVIWVSGDVVLTSQPAQSFMQRIEDWFFMHLPIEDEM